MTTTHDDPTENEDTTMRTARSTRRRRNATPRRASTSTTHRRAVRPRSNAARTPAWYRKATLGDVARRSTRDIVRWLAWNDRNGDYGDITTRHDALVTLVYTFAGDFITEAQAQASAMMLGKAFPEPRR